MIWNARVVNDHVVEGNPAGLVLLSHSLAGVEEQTVTADGVDAKSVSRVTS